MRSVGVEPALYSSVWLRLYQEDQRGAAVMLQDGNLLNLSGGWQFMGDVQSCIVKHDKGG